MKRLAVTIKRSIFINKSREKVWDFTQDYSNRTKWDNSVLHAELIETYPNRVINIKAKGNNFMKFVYKLDKRPDKTTLTAKEIISPIVASAGGSWSYEEHNGGTLWTQNNTLILKNKFFIYLLLPLYKFFLARQMKKAMQRAKSIIEKDN